MSVSPLLMPEEEPEKCKDPVRAGGVLSVSAARRDQRRRITSVPWMEALAFALLKRRMAATFGLLPADVKKRRLPAPLSVAPAHRRAANRWRALPTPPCRDRADRPPPADAPAPSG